MWRHAIERQQHAVGHGRTATRNPIMTYFVGVVELNISDMAADAAGTALPAGFTAIFLTVEASGSCSFAQAKCSS
jgi:hypothetical protein